MSGTPVLSTLADRSGRNEADPPSGCSQCNSELHLLTAMESGKSYDEALDEARRIGLAERDASADVDGYDSMAKTMILAGLVFGEQLQPNEVFRRGIAGIDRDEVMAATESDTRVRLVSTLEYSGGRRTARVEPVHLPMADPLPRIDGVTNAVVCDAQPVGEVTITGPGAGLAVCRTGCPERSHRDRSTSCDWLDLRGEEPARVARSVRRRSLGRRCRPGLFPFQGRFHGTTEDAVEDDGEEP
jgi:homoserine dehydrogenase